MHTCTACFYKAVVVSLSLSFCMATRPYLYKKEGVSGSGGLTAGPIREVELSTAWS